MKVNLTKDINRKITCSRDAFEVMLKILIRQSKLLRQKEYFWVIGLNTANAILYIEVVSIGSLNMIIIDPVEVFNFAVAKKYNKIILIHNHPSGNTEPSSADLQLTAQLIQGGSYLKIEIVDHIIITENNYFTLADIGFFELREGKKKI